MEGIFAVTLEESFSLGRLEGLKEAYREILELSATEMPFFKVYLKARLKSIEENILHIEKFRSGLRMSGKNGV